MPGKSRSSSPTERGPKGKKRRSSKSPAAGSSSATGSSSAAGATAKPPPAGWIVSCDIPLKQYIIKLNDDKSADKKFILEELDDMHILIDGRVREELMQKTDDFMDENVWSSAERVGENLGLD
jgi:hypothetical protein